MKYVTFTGYQGEQIIVFPKVIQHSDFARQVTELSYGGLHPISGGFVANGVCYGESVSLRMKSRGDADTELLQALAYRDPVRAKQQDDLKRGIEDDGIRIINNGSNIQSKGRESNKSTIVNAGTKIGRNERCPCGSGKKYKNCCL